MFNKYVILVSNCISFTQSQFLYKLWNCVVHYEISIMISMKAQPSMSSGWWFSISYYCCKCQLLISWLFNAVLCQVLWLVLFFQKVWFCWLIGHIATAIAVLPDDMYIHTIIYFKLQHSNCSYLEWPKYIYLKIKDIQWYAFIKVLYYFFHHFSSIFPGF